MLMTAVRNRIDIVHLLAFDQDLSPVAEGDVSGGAGSAPEVVDVVTTVDSLGVEGFIRSGVLLSFHPAESSFKPQRSDQLTAALGTTRIGSGTSSPVGNTLTTSQFSHVLSFKSRSFTK
jgi:hypothetical protein